VHVWRVALDVTDSTVEYLLPTLCVAERQRAERFHFQKDRRQFVVTRAVLRIILGRYLEREPSTLSFCYNQYGKPELTSTSDRSQTIRFNLSHSHGLALIAVAQNLDIGIDIEYIHPNVSWEQIAQSYFSPKERDMLHQLPAALRVLAFFTVWTRKEAYIKATGKGLSLPLDRFDVSVAPGAAKLLNVQWDEREASRWFLVELTPGSGYAATLAAGAGNWQIKLWQWSFPILP
jgi:4'-phosphopantetheinyl transferase